MQFSWFDLYWSWVGLAISTVLLILLFGTKIFRSDDSISRWRDPVWLAWLAPAAYMFHQFEEYGIDVLGNHFPFPDLLCASFSMPPYPDCSIPVGTYLGINISVIWGMGLVCGLLSWRFPLVGLGVFAIHGTNSIAHLGTFAITGIYNPGSMTSAIIQLPMFLWMAYALAGHPAIRKSGVALLFGVGVLFTMILMGSLKLFAEGAIGDNLVVLIQVLNPVLLVAILFLVAKGRTGSSSVSSRPELA